MDQPTVKEHHKDIQAQVDAYIETQSQLDLLRFITCGSVDDGKSTLIGRMLYEAQLIFEDQVTSLQNDSKKMGTYWAFFALNVTALKQGHDFGADFNNALSGGASAGAFLGGDIHHAWLIIGIDVGEFTHVRSKGRSLRVH